MSRPIGVASASVVTGPSPSSRPRSSSINAASLDAGLAVPFLGGDESVRLVNLDPQGDTEFQLPGERPRIGLDIGKGMQEPEVVLHTVMIRMEERQVDLVWRGAVPYPGPDWLPEMKKLEVLVA